MQTETSNIENMREKDPKLPEWVVILMQAYQEYINTLEAEDGK